MALTQDEVKNHFDHFLEVRQKCRTDLLYLCNEVLDYKDVNQEVHGPLIEKLQLLIGGKDYFNEKGIYVGYIPKCANPYDLPGPRRRLFLDPRGFLKTTLLTVAHAIQWVINYPDIRILVCHANGDRAREILTEIKGHFQYNKKFRWFFPEHCPEARKASDFGNQEQFTTKARTRKWTKEATLQVSSIESTTAGTHMEVILCTDIVEKENVRTIDRIRQINSSFAQLQFLLDRPAKAWLQLEGTCYDWSDLYTTILESERKKPVAERVWQVHRRGITDEDGNPVWPSRFPLEDIAKIRNDPTMTPYIFSCQYHNLPIATADALFDDKLFQWTPPDVIKAFCKRYHCTVDLSSPDPLRSKSSMGDFTVLCVSGFDAYNRMYVTELIRGRFKPSEVIDFIFQIFDRYAPNLLDFKIEDASGARQIFPFLERERVKRKKWPIISLIKRDNQVSKQDRIMGLQAWFKSGDIRFAENLAWKEEMLLEFTRFPRYAHDDIADTIADQMQNRFMGPYKTEEETVREAHPRPWWMEPAFVSFEEEELEGRMKFR